MTSYADLAREARTVILGLVDTIEMKGVTQARVDVLLRAVETETRCRRPGCDEYVKRAARSYVAGLLERGDYTTIRTRYSRPAQVEPAPWQQPAVVPVDLDALNPPPAVRPAVRPAPRPAPRPPTPAAAPRPPHPVVDGLQAAVVHHRHTTTDYVNQLHVLKQVIAGLLIAAVVFGLGVATIQGIRTGVVDVAAQGPWCAMVIDRDADLDTSCITDHR